MEYLIIIGISIIFLLLLFFVFGINFKELKKAGKDKELDGISNKFPENIDICKSILKKLNNEKVKIKENNEYKSSLYIAITNTIIIANIKDSYTRIQTIAHECLHSIQPRKIQLFNFFFSNYYLLYFVIVSILTILGIIKNYQLQILIIIILGFIYYFVRSYLENEAMIKAQYLAKEYMEEYININDNNKDNINDNDINKIEIKKIFEKYNEINKIGIPASNYVLIFNCIFKVITYCIIVMLTN